MEEAEEEANQFLKWQIRDDNPVTEEQEEKITRKNESEKSQSQSQSLNFGVPDKEKERSVVDMIQAPTNNENNVIFPSATVSKRKTEKKKNNKNVIDLTEKKSVDNEKDLDKIKNINLSSSSSSSPDKSGVNIPAVLPFSSLVERFPHLSSKKVHAPVLNSVQSVLEKSALPEDYTEKQNENPFHPRLFWMLMQSLPRPVFEEQNMYSSKSTSSRVNRDGDESKLVRELMERKKRIPLSESSVEDLSLMQSGEFVIRKHKNPTLIKWCAQDTSFANECPDEMTVNWPPCSYMGQCVGNMDFGITGLHERVLLTGYLTKEEIKDALTSGDSNKLSLIKRPCVLCCRYRINMAVLQLKWTRRSFSFYSKDLQEHEKSILKDKDKDKDQNSKSNH